ncbi:merozoite surface protein CMZ-8-like [Oncorhynchus mykiss]|uniref:merozoite surface protein CMZ-8-like n=1 Tax=Oncorhynchus mykiss TaxID=8022 RepID=UPI0018783E09|nr:merozoite surface protein CMZ-8-like [Oncorhynchus mykiss]
MVAVRGGQVTDDPVSLPGIQSLPWPVPSNLPTTPFHLSPPNTTPFHLKPPAAFLLPSPAPSNLSPPTTSPLQPSSPHHQPPPTFLLPPPAPSTLPPTPCNPPRSPRLQFLLSLLPSLSSGLISGGPSLPPSGAGLLDRADGESGPGGDVL